MAGMVDWPAAAAHGRHHLCDDSPIEGSFFDWKKAATDFRQARGRCPNGSRLAAVVGKGIIKGGTAIAEQNRAAGNAAIYRTDGGDG